MATAPPTAKQLQTRRRQRHWMRGDAIKMGVKDACGQAPYYFVSGDWAGMTVRCEPRKFSPIPRAS